MAQSPFLDSQMVKQVGLAPSDSHCGHVGSLRGGAEQRCSLGGTPEAPPAQTEGLQVTAGLLCTADVCFSLHPQIREQNLQDIKTAGPQSQVLCGVVMDRSLVQVRAQNV